MALIKCPKCGKEISDKAKKCVGCGWEVNLNILNAKKITPDLGKDISGEIDSKKDMSHTKDEQNKILKNAELEIEKVKENARQKVKSINESAKAMVTQKQKELELEYRKKEKELAQQKESLEKAQIELERTKKEQAFELQHTEMPEKKTNFSNINVLFMVVPTVIMICFMVVVWRRLDKFSTEIEVLTSDNQTESEMLIDDTENMLGENSDDIISMKTQGDYKELELNEDSPIEDIPESDTGENVSEDNNVETAINSENDSRIQITYDSCKTGRYTELVFTIKNVSNENITISVNSYQYINDVAVKKFGSIEYNSEIPAGKATIVNYTFDRNDVSFSDIKKIEFGCTSSNGTDAEIENSFIFDGLNINIK